MLIYIVIYLKSCLNAWKNFNSHIFRLYSVFSAKLTFLMSKSSIFFYRYYEFNTMKNDGQHRSMAVNAATVHDLML